MVREKGDDPDEQRVIDDIREYGWHVVGIEADESGPAFAYSVGLQHSFDHPEIIVFGLNDAETMMYIINTIGEAVQNGSAFEDWHESDQILNGYSCVFRKIPAEAYPDYLGYANWFYRPSPFAVLQCFWPDKQHRFPWDRDCNPTVQQRQPILSEQDDWPFCEGKNRLAFTTRPVIEGTRPISLVVHSADDDWQFLCGTTSKSEDGKLVSLETILAMDSSIASIADLPRGWQASRNSVDGDWQRSECS